jgi:hypothetical protein
LAANCQDDSQQFAKEQNCCGFFLQTLRAMFRINEGELEVGHVNLAPYKVVRRNEVLPKGQH